MRTSYNSSSIKGQTKFLIDHTSAYGHKAPTKVVWWRHEHVHWQIMACLRMRPCEASRGAQNRKMLYFASIIFEFKLQKMTRGFWPPRNFWDWLQWCPTSAHPSNWMWFSIRNFCSQLAEISVLIIRCSSCVCRISDLTSHLQEWAGMPPSSM